MASLPEMVMPLTLLLVTLLISPPAIATVIELPGESHSYCESWRLAVEANNAAPWKTVPAKCKYFVAGYVNSDQYDSDYQIIADYAIDFAETVRISGDGKDAWVFDIDETLLTNMEYYRTHGYGSEPFDEKSFNAWVDRASAPAFDASMRLYNKIQKLGFTIFLLTGRDEEHRSITEKNLRYAGYSGWKHLILRGRNDVGKTATIYKSERRMELMKKGYKIHGSTGDQWSDLLGFAVAKRSFKVPNPMYYVP